jgi:hypothetical protein
MCGSGRFLRDADNLLAEIPGALLIHVPLETQHAARRDLAGGDLVHDRPLSVQAVDYMTGQVPTRRMFPLDLGPAPGGMAGRGSRLQTEYDPDLGEWEPDLAKGRDKARLLQLPGLVRAIAGVRIDARRGRRPSSS